MIDPTIIRPLADVTLVAGGLAYPAQYATVLYVAPDDRLCTNMVRGVVAWDDVTALVTGALDDGWACTTPGGSVDMADDAMGCVMRFAEYRKDHGCLYLSRVMRPLA